MDITVKTTNGYHDLDFFSIEMETNENVAHAFYSLILWAAVGVCGEKGEGEGIKIIRKKPMTLFMDGSGLT